MKLHSLRILLAGLALSLGSLAAAEQPYQAQSEKLEALRAQIQRVQSELKDHRVRQDGLSGELRGIDERVGRIVARLRRLDEQDQETRRRVEGLRKEYAQHERRMRGHREYLSRQLVSAYAAGRQALLKLLLNQEDPGRLDRMLVYHRYLNDARGERINEAVAELQRLAVIQRALDEELAALAELRQKQRREQQELSAAREERADALARIERSIAAKGQQLARLQDDEGQLLKLLEELRNALADIQDPRLQRRPFKDSRGRLDWPLAGTLAARYGDPRVGGLRWSGVVIEAGEGSSVKAVSNGHVVFADWLRGLGLLIIIDHGDGYMTLYGHNEAIYKEAGDWVQAGDVIATVGASGGRRQAGLYFEIRAAGKPVDPLEWLQAKRDA